MLMLVNYHVYADKYLYPPNTYEYFYQDIVSVETTESVFVLTSSGGTKIELPLLLEREKQVADLERARTAVRNVRAMLRERKATPLGGTT
jgi:hypothetical protein